MTSISCLNNDVFERIIYYTPKRERATLFATCRHLRDLVWHIQSRELNHIFSYAKGPLLQSEVPFRVACNNVKRKITLLSNYVHDPRIELILNLFVIRVIKISKDYWNPRTLLNPIELLRENIYGLQLQRTKRDYFFDLNALLPDEQKLPIELAPLPDQSIQILMNAYRIADSSSTHPAIKEAIALIDPVMTRSYRPIIDFYANLGRKDITGLLLQNGADPNVEYYIEGTPGNWIPLVRVFNSFMDSSRRPISGATEVDFPGTLEVLLKAQANIYQSTLWITIEGPERVSLFSQLLKTIHFVLHSENSFSADLPTANCLATTLTLIIQHSIFSIDYQQVLALTNAQGVSFMDLIAESFPELHALINKGLKKIP